MAAFGGAGCLAVAARHICPLESPSSRVPAHDNPIITKESVHHAIVAAARRSSFGGSSTGPVRGSAFGRGGGPPPFFGPAAQGAAGAASPWPPVGLSLGGCVCGWPSFAASAAVGPSPLPPRRSARFAAVGGGPPTRPFVRPPSGPCVAIVADRSGFRLPRVCHGSSRRRLAARGNALPPQHPAPLRNGRAGNRGTRWRANGVPRVLCGLSWPFSGAGEGGNMSPPVKIASQG